MLGASWTIISIFKPHTKDKLQLSIIVTTWHYKAKLDIN